MRAFHLLPFVALAATGAAQQILVPPATAALNPGSSTAAWRSTAFRFQMVYDNSLFTARGVNGPVTIQRLRFRAEDSEANLGGQVYSGVSVRLCDTPTTQAVVATLATSATASTTTVIQTSGLVASEFASGSSDAQRCFSIVFTSGVNVGLARLVSANDATSITVSAAFPAAPGPGDTFDVVRAPIGYQNLAQAFAANVGANVGASETFASVTVTPASGGIPNDYVVDVPLTSAAFVYDPTTMGNLVIEVACAAPPAPNATSLVPFATSAVAATSKARRLSQSSASAVTGGLSDFAAIVLLDFAGPGGVANASAAATVVGYGGACNQQSANIAQYFGNEDFDLRGTFKSLTFTPDDPVAPTRYTVTGDIAAVDLGMALGTADTTDDGVVAHTPPWTTPFAFPGGTTTTIGACTNGYVWLGSGGGDFSPTVAEWLGGGSANLPARFAPFWHDFHAGRNTAGYVASGMYVHTDTSAGPGNAVTYVTWREVGEWNTVTATAGHSVNTFQCVLHEATRVVEFRYDLMSGCRWGNGITGFTRGSLGGGVDCTDSGSRDLSDELPFTSNTNGPSLPLTLATSARPVLGTAATFTASNIPAELGIGILVHDIVGLRPGAPLPGWLEPGCLLSVALTPGANAMEVSVPASATWTSAPFAYPAADALVGVHLFSQFVFWRASTLTMVSSNALDMKLGHD